MNMNSNTAFAISIVAICTFLAVIVIWNAPDDIRKADKIRLDDSEFNLVKVERTDSATGELIFVYERVNP